MTHDYFIPYYFRSVTTSSKSKGEKSRTFLMWCSILFIHTAGCLVFADFAAWVICITVNSCSDSPYAFNYPTESDGHVFKTSVKYTDIIILVHCEVRDQWRRPRSNLFHFDTVYGKIFFK